MSLLYPFPKYKIYSARKWTEDNSNAHRQYKIRGFTLLKALTEFSLASPLSGVYDTRYCRTWALGWTQVTSILTAVSSEMDKLLGPPPDTKAAQKMHQLFSCCSQRYHMRISIYSQVLYRIATASLWAPSAYNAESEIWYSLSSSTSSKIAPSLSPSTVNCNISKNYHLLSPNSINHTFNVSYFNQYWQHRCNTGSVRVGANLPEVSFTQGDPFDEIRHHVIRRRFPSHCYITAGEISDSQIRGSWNSYWKIKDNIMNNLLKLSNKT